MASQTLLLLAILGDYGSLVPASMDCSVRLTMSSICTQMVGWRERVFIYMQEGYLGLLTGANAERTPLCATKSKTRLQPNPKIGNRNGSTSASNTPAANNKSSDWNLSKVGVPFAAGGNFQRSLAHRVVSAAYQPSAQVGPRFYLIE